MQEKQALFDEEECIRWMRQAEHTWASAKRDAEAGDFGWACFKAQQAADYAVKALLWGFGLPAAGHSILRLLMRLAEEDIAIPEEAYRCARNLDRHYIPPRYPNAYPVGSPFEFYDETTAAEAIRCCEFIISFIREIKERYVQNSAETSRTPG